MAPLTMDNLPVKLEHFVRELDGGHRGAPSATPPRSKRQRSPDRGRQELHRRRRHHPDQGRAVADPMMLKENKPLSTPSRPVLPVIAINGHRPGGGLEARHGQPLPRPPGGSSLVSPRSRSLIPGAGGTRVLPRRRPPPNAREMITTAMSPPKRLSSARQDRAKESEPQPLKAAALPPAGSALKPRHARFRHERLPSAAERRRPCSGLRP